MAGSSRNHSFRKMLCETFAMDHREQRISRNRKNASAIALTVVVWLMDVFVTS